MNQDVVLAKEMYEKAAAQEHGPSIKALKQLDGPASKKKGKSKPKKSGASKKKKKTNAKRKIDTDEDEMSPSPPLESMTPAMAKKRRDDQRAARKLKKEQRRAARLKARGWDEDDAESMPETKTDQDQRETKATPAASSTKGTTDKTQKKEQKKEQKTAKPENKKPTDKKSNNKKKATKGNAVKPAPKKKVAASKTTDLDTDLGYCIASNGVVLAILSILSHHAASGPFFRRPEYSRLRCCVHRLTLELNNLCMLLPPGTILIH